jgi:hypothetical protein
MEVQPLPHGRSQRKTERFLMISVENTEHYIRCEICEAMSVIQRRVPEGGAEVMQMPQQPGEGL